jgi:hypothetical protein
MMRPQSFRQLAAYGISLPAFAVSPKLAKETVYLPSQVAEQALGTGSMAPKQAEPEKAVNREP